MAMFRFLIEFGRFLIENRRFLKCENVQKLKHHHEMHQYWSVDDDFGVVRQLRVPAFQRCKARQNPLGRRPIRDHSIHIFSYIFLY